MIQSSDPVSVTRFVLLFQGRSGSTYLTQAIRSHPQVKARGERVGGLPENPRQLEKMSAFLLRDCQPECRAIGFKKKLRDIRDHRGFAALLTSLDARIIHLERRNVVKRAVSLFNALRLHEKTGAWNLYSRSNELRTRLHIDPDELEARLEEYRVGRSQLLGFIAEARRPTLTLYYEDLLASHDAVLNMAFGFLGVDRHAGRGHCHKNTSDNLREALVNFDELRAAYAGSEYEEMFDEVLAGQFDSNG